MKLLVFSDSHSDSKSMREIILMQRGGCDAVAFLGDGVRDINKIKDDFPSIAFYIVKGNCDLFAPSVEEELLIDFDGLKIFMTHGHNYGAKSGCGRLIYRARELEADAVLFGHTHQMLDSVIEVQGRKIRIFNPGSVGHEGAFGVLNTSNGVIVTSHGKI